MPDPEKEHTNGVSDDALDSPERPGSPGTPSGERDVAEGDRDPDLPQGAQAAGEPPLDRSA